jgi:tripartite-type tricarboxylate transporter receptor subunit TctC
MRQARNILALLMTGLVLAVAAGRGAQAAGYPDHPVKIIVPFPAGGITDVVARMIAQNLSERLGRQFFIDDIGGAGGNIGMAAAARAPGDGYTVLFASSSIVVNPSLYKKVPFDAAKDFIAVTKAGATPNAWMVNRDFAAKSMGDLTALMKAHPGKYSVASPGAGTTPSLSIEMLKQDLGVDFVTVPFTGGSPLNQSLLGGFTPIACSAFGNSAPLMLQGKVRALAIAGKSRLQALPDVPTLAETGIKNEEAETMTGVFVPAGTPAPVVALLQKQIAEIVQLPAVKAKLLGFGIIPEGDSTADFQAYVKDEIAKWNRVIENGKIDKM